MKGNERISEIKMLMEEKEITQKGLAIKVGISAIHLNGVLNQRYPLTEMLYQRLINHLKIWITQ